MESVITANASASTDNAGPIGVKTCARFLLGHRDAILRIAGSRGATWIGLLFVISAGFAREYDQEDLLHEPWHLAIPLAASIGLSLVLHATFWACVPQRNRRAFWPRYRVFLTVFWMTAPMAWLYAIPYERFLDAANSVLANLWTLALVACWRVLLISRVISLLTNQKFATAFVVVLAIADVAVQIALWNASLPLLSIMGGVRMSHADLIVANTTFLIRLFGTLGLFLLIPAAVLAVVLQRRAHQTASAIATGSDRISPALTALAAVSVVIWAGILPFTQPEQRLRWEAETCLKAGRIAQAIESMSAHPREAFPPHWDPPPRVGYDESPPLLDVMDVLCDGRGRGWVREAYLDKFSRSYLSFRRLHFLSEPEAERAWAILNRLPERDRLMTEDVKSWREHMSATQPASAPTTQRN